MSSPTVSTAIGLGLAAVTSAGIARIATSGTSPQFQSTAQIDGHQKAAIAAYFLIHDPIGDEARVGCPVDVLGASTAANEVIAYTVVHCWTGTKQCASGSFNGTIGVVARIRGNKVLSETFDDANDYVGGLAEASIFPSALRTEALELMSYNGPPAYDHLARTMAGC